MVIQPISMMFLHYIYCKVPQVQQVTVNIGLDADVVATKTTVSPPTLVAFV